MKRVVSVFFCLIFSLALLMLRLYALSTDPAVRSGNPNASMTIEVATARGTIYDRNGQPFVNETTQRLAVVSPTETALPLLRGATDDDAFEQAYQRLSAGLPAVVPVQRDVAGEGVRMVYRPVRYGGTLLLAHLAGYCDGTGVGICGLEKSYESVLCTRTCTATFPVNAAGRVLSGAAVRMRDAQLCTLRGVVLTLDKDLQRIVRDVMQRASVRKGAAVLLDVHSGDILAMVSLPEWDILHLRDSLSDPDAPFVNRALNAVSVGSVYKTIVAAAALECGVSPDETYTCTGSVRQDGVVFHCHLRTGHGTLDMRQAMRYSCNPWFIHLAGQIPLRTLLELSAAAGFGSAAELAPGLIADAGILPAEETLSTSASRANLAFGQGKLTATPLQIAAATAVFANGGIYRAPRLVLATQDDDGTRTGVSADSGTRIIREKTAQTVRKMLVYAAENTAQFGDFRDCGGKTATAQTGVYRQGTEQLNAWYSGFFPAQEPRYVLTVLCEDGTSGTQDCIPLFVEIAKLVEKNEKNGCKSAQDTV